MPSKPQTLTLKRTVNAPPADVYRAFTNPTALRDWLSTAAQADPRKGGRLYLWWGSGVYASGEFTALETGKKVAFVWNHSREPEPARIQVALASQNGGTAVTLKHTVRSVKKWAAAIHGAQEGWKNALENLASVLETGIDLRVARLPRLGVLIGDFNAEIAAQLGVPVAQGIRLEGTAEGTGAQAAGLQKDDVIVKLAGKKAVDFPTLANALQGHHAGDQVAVVFYRAGEKKAVALELSRRPWPEMPPTAEALAVDARKVYDETNAELARMVEGASDAEASRQPAPGEWSLKELLAHYVACERDLQSWIAEMLNGGNNIGEVQDSLEFRPNVTVRLDALVARYPTVPDLLQELKRSQSETLAILAALPAEFVARKHLYRRLGAWITQVIPEHIPDHRDQFAATLEAARRGT